MKIHRYCPRTGFLEQIYTDDKKVPTGWNAGWIR